MTDVEATYEGFIGSRRTGRRNAVHDMPAAAAADPPGGEQLGPAAAAGDLAQGLAQLNINKSGNEGEGSEKIQDSSAKEQESQAEDN